MWEKFVFFVPRLADRFAQNRALIHWLLQQERERTIKLTFREQKGQLVVSSIVDYWAFRYIVYDLFANKITFYVSATLRAETPMAARYLLKEQGISYEVSEMNIYVRPRQDADSLDESSN